MIVNKFKLTNSVPVVMAMIHGATVSMDQSPATLMQMKCMCGILYAEAISSILWPVVVLQPDVAFTMSLLTIHS